MRFSRNLSLYLRIPLNPACDSDDSCTRCAYTSQASVSQLEISRKIRRYSYNMNMAGNSTAIAPTGLRVSPIFVSSNKPATLLDHKKRIAIVIEYMPNIINACHRILRTARLPFEVKEDILQGVLESFTAFIVKTPSERLANIKFLLPYSRRLATMRVLELLRNHSSHRKHFPSVSIERTPESTQSYPPDFEASPDAPKQLEIFKQTIEALDEEEGNIYIMYFLDGLLQSEIANQIGYTPANISQKIARILRKIISAQRKHGYL